MFENIKIVDIDVVEDSAEFDLEDNNSESEVKETFELLYGKDTEETKITLNNDEIVELISRTLSGDAGARNELFNAHIKWASGLAYRVYSKGEIIAKEDLEQVAMLGLTKALDVKRLSNFDPKRAVEPGNKFTKYAYWYVTGELLNTVYKELKVTKAERSMQKEISILEDKIKKEGGKWPADMNEQQNLVVEKLGLDPKKVKKLYDKYVPHCSLDSTGVDENDEEYSLYNYIENENPSTERQALSKTILGEIYKGLEESQKVILDCVQKEEMYNWLIYKRHYGEIAKRINSNYEDLTKKEKAIEKENLAKSIKEILNVTKRICSISEKQITDVIQNNEGISKFEAYLVRCIGDFKREKLKEKVNEYLYDKKYIEPSDTIAYMGYFTEYNGRPLRNELIAIAFTEELNALDLNELLKKSGCSELYVRQPEDLALYFALNNNYDLEQYIALCNKLKDIVEPKINDMENGLVIGGLKDRLKTYEEAEKDLEDSKTITERMFNGASEWIKGNGDEDGFIEFIVKNKENFVAVRERTYRVMMGLLLDYIAIACSTRKNRYISGVTMNDEKPVDERKIKTMGLLEQMIEFCDGDPNDIDTNKRNLLSRVIKSYSAEVNNGIYPFELTRDAFLSMATFFKQYEDYGDDRRKGFIESMNRDLKLAGFDELDSDSARDRSIINVGVWGKINNETIDKIDYEVFFDGILGIVESKRRSQYTFM